MIKVASYCRVSTDKEDQANSFEAQKRYFCDYIRSHPDWELYEIYADEGITGTSTKKRTQFNRMISDAYEGRFHIIITKEVSRFSRNILDTIAYTRELRGIGVGVIFANDRINTLEPEAEMLLSFLASLAQEESRRTSSRVVWGQTRQMERGVVFGRSLLGYTVKNGQIAVEPEGAEIVRMIFHKYATEQIGASEIAHYMNCKGYHTYGKKGAWKANAVIKILKNEKYVGDLVQRKTYTPDFLTHEKRPNRGEVPMVIIRDHHEPIISRDVWDMAQERLRKNNKHREGDGGHSNRYVFSGKIKCGECGDGFVGRCKYRKDGTKIRRWSCAVATKDGRSACDVGKLVRDDDAMQMLRTAIRSLPVDFQRVIRNMTQLVTEAARRGENGNREESERLKSDMERIRQKKEAVMDSYFSREISKEDMQAMNRKYDCRLEELRRKLRDTNKQLVENRDACDIRLMLETEITAILYGERECEVFYKSVLESMTVFKNRHIELRLNWLPHVFIFA